MLLLWALASLRQSSRLKDDVSNDTLVGHVAARMVWFLVRFAGMLLWRFVMCDANVGFDRFFFCETILFIACPLALAKSYLLKGS